MGRMKESNLKKESEPSSVKNKVLVSVEEAICLSEAAVEDILDRHKWQHKKWRDDRVLDAASKCFKNNAKIREIRGEIMEINCEDEIAEEFENFDREYAWVEKNLEELVDVVNKV